MKSRLRGALTVAMKEKNTSEASLLRVLIAAVDNAEATPVQAERPSLVRHDFWDGSAEVERLFLDEDRVRAIISNEIAARECAADEFDRLGKTDRADRLREEAAIGRKYLED
jgi:uncharacterized protein